MGVAYNPKIVTNGLVMALDAANPNKSAKGFKNLLDLSTWTLGTGSVTGFSQNGTTAENQRILDTGPHGVSTVVWDTPSNDVASDGDGGWDGSTISIDKTKMYRFSVWIRRKFIGDGYYYLGCAAGVLNRSDGVLNNNPYFSASTWPLAVNEWMLVVGHVWPAGSGTGTNHADSGLWNTSGTKFSGPTSAGDFVWQTSSTTTNLRTYLYYSVNASTNQQWYQPRIDLVDGTEPTIAELISGVGSKWYDLTCSNHSNILNSPALYNTSGYMNFDGIDDAVDCGGNLSIKPTSGITVSTWIKFNGVVGNNRILSDWHQAGSGGDRWTFVTPNSTTVVWYMTSNGQIEGGTNGYNINLGQWVNLTGTYNQLQQIFYVNGVQYSSISRTGLLYAGDGSQTVRVGRQAEAGSTHNGLISNVYMYNRALTAAEIQQNFNATRGRYGI